MLFLVELARLCTRIILRRSLGVTLNNSMLGISVVLDLLLNVS